MNIDASSKVCPICGYEFPGYTTSTRLVAFLLAILMLIGVILAVIGYF